MKKTILFFLLLFNSNLVWAHTSDEYYKAGLGLYQQKHYEKAVPYFRAAIQLNPDDWRSYQVLGQSYYQENQKDLALNAFEKSLQLNSNNPSLQAFVQRLHSTAAASVQSQNKINHQLANNRVFIKSSYGIGTGPSGDIAKGLNALAGRQTTNELSTSVYLDSEIGYSFDPYNAIGLTSQGISPNGSYYANYFTNSGYPQTDDYWLVNGVSSISLGLCYDRFFPDNDGRWFGKVGVNYYIASLTYEPSSFYSANVTTEPVLLSDIQYSFSSSTIGANLEFGREFHLFWIIGAELSIQASYASFGQWTEGTNSLAVDGSGKLTVVPNQQIGQNGYRNAVLDMTTVGLKFGFCGYF